MGTVVLRPGFIFLGLILTSLTFLFFLKPEKKILALFAFVLALGCFYPFLRASFINPPESRSVEENIIMRPLFYAKEKFADNLRQNLSPSSSALALGILLGDKSGFSFEFAKNMKDSGTSHITALSGFNVTVIVSFISALLFFVPIKLKPFAVLIGIIIFVALVGPSPSIVRAAIMGSLAVLGTNMGRLVDVKSPMALAATLMVLHNPEIIVYDAGFILSFSAFFGIAFITPWIRNKFFKEKEVGAFKKIFIESISAETAVALPAMIIFGSFNWLSFIPNIMIIWSVPFAMAFSFASGVTSFLSNWLSFPLSMIAEIILQYEIGIINISARCFQYFGF
jgi:competence protein ComEC